MNKRNIQDVIKQQEADAETEGARVQGSTALVRATSSAIVIGDGANPWVEIGTEIGRFIGAPFLKFTKTGEFEISDTETIPDGTKVIAHVDEVELGWLKWQDGRPVERRVGRIADRFVPPPRPALGDTDENLWELQPDGSRRDCWQFQMMLPVTCLDNNERYDFTTSSRGGLACITRLVRDYGRRVRDEKVPSRPVVTLKSSFYKHPKYGKIFEPKMPIVNWTGADGKPLSVADDMNDEIPL
jgi:hypothetical protein